MKKQIQKNMLFVVAILMLLNTKTIFAQSDNCATATNIVVNAAPVAGTTAGSSFEPGEITPGTTGLTGAPTHANSVWYSFVATSTQHTVNIEQVSGACFNMYSGVYRGNCASRQIISSYARNYATQTHYLNSLTIGNTYLIQITYNNGGGCGNKGFTIEVTTGAELGLDLCICGGTEQSVIGEPGTCLIADLKGASTCLANGCAGAGDRSISLFFTPTATSLSVNVDNVQGSFSGNVQVQLYTFDTYTNYSTCGPLFVSSNCGGLPYSNTFTGLTAGKQYRIIISTANNSEGCNTAFAICVNNGAPCAASCSPPAVEPPGGGAYGIFAADGTATVNSTQVTATGGFSGCGGAGPQCLVCTPTDDSYTSVPIAGYPIIGVSNITCLNSVMTFTTADPSPSWPAGALGTNASFAPLPSALNTLSPNSYTATLGRRTINITGDVNQPSTDYRKTPITAIPDNGCGTGTSLVSSITVSAHPCATVVSSLTQVRVNIQHTFDSDITMYLIAPNGDRLKLAQANGAAGDNFTNTVFSDAGATNISAGVAPFTGTFRPLGTVTAACGITANRASFNAIGGGTINPNGTWQLVIFDAFLGDAGTLVDWTLTLPGCSQTNQAVTYPGFVNMMMAQPSAGAVLGSNRVCPNVASNYGSSVAGTAGYTYLWTAPTVSGNVPVIASPTSSYTNITFTNNTVTTLTYITSLTVTSECCGTLPVVTYSVQVLPDPAAPAVVDATPSNCIGGTTSLDVVPAPGFTYAWYTTATGTNLLTTGPTYVVTNTLTGTNSYFAQAIDAFGCPSTRTPVALTGTNSPPSVGDASICAPGNVTLNIVAPTPGTTYTWYTGSCGGTVMQSTASIAYTQNFAATTNLYISAREPGCAESTCDMATVTLGAAPPTVYWSGAGITGLNNWFDANNWATSLGTPAATFTNTTATASLTTGANPCLAPRHRNNTITVSGYTGAIPMAGTTIKVSMSSHANLNDVSMFLIAPNGEILGLNNQRGNNGACTVTNLTFSDGAAGVWPATTCPAAGTSYRPPAAAFTACTITSDVFSFATIGGGTYNPNGVWTLKLVDQANNNGGGAIAVGGWSIMFPAVGPSGNCLPSCATNVVIPNTAGLPVTNPPDIGFTAGLRAQAQNLDLANGNTLSFSNSRAVLDICGNFTHAGTLRTNNLGTVWFVGTAGQTYTNTTTVTTVTTRTDNTFHQVRINNTGLYPNDGVTVNGNMTIGNMATYNLGDLQFLNGVIKLPAANRLTIANRATTAISGQSITNYVAHVDPTSILRRYLATTGGSYNFPVGNTNRNSYQLQNLNFNTGHGIDFIDVNFSNPANATGTGLPIVEPLLSNYYAVVKNGGINATTDNANGGVWTVTPNVAGTATYTSTLYGTNLATVGSTIRHTVLKRTTAGPGPWLLDGTYVSSTLTSPITAVRSGMSGFSQFAIGMSDLVVTLPIKLDNFTATCNDDVVTLKWSTIKEDSKGSFVVEKSQNGIEFEAVKKVDAYGKSNSKQYYSAIDSKPNEGLTYYRLKITDKDGNTDFSKVVEVKMPCTPAQNVFYIFPNPAKTEAKVVFTSNLEGIAFVKVKNALGQEIILNKVEMLVGENSSNLNLAGFATGVYMVTVTTDTETMTGKLVVNND